MTITPDTTPAAPADPAHVDQALAQLATTSADMLAGIIAAGMLQAVGNPTQLPQLLFSHLPADEVRPIWDLALAVGMAAGERRFTSRWRPEELDAHQRALNEAGYTVMATLVSATASHGRRPTTDTAPEQHPADTERKTTRGAHR